MIEAYLSGDTYIAFGKQIRALPDDATDRTHKIERQLYKSCILGLNYGMGELSLSYRIGRPPITARHLIEAHKRTYRTFWEWSEAKRAQTTPC